MGKRSDKPAHRSAAAGAAHPPSLQVGALCFRRTAQAHKVLLITSRDTGRWVIPKGWPMRNRTEPEAAAREAFEEAGVRGTVGERCVGIYGYPKRLKPGRLVPCVVRIYPLEVSEMLDAFPERGQRKIRWLSPEKAAERVKEPELARLIRVFRPDQPELHA
jgi:8-oxo-dGTP pyrophosphatase MutT (NUDIX family)